MKGQLRAPDDPHQRQDPALLPVRAGSSENPSRAGPSVSVEPNKSTPPVRNR
ncbi:hypothetical protein [Streptomyces cyaneofuscatus]|uniref:hypothetical protein n=1 Tax=Streptomyces cyaneofuscatus TaxID=66883 RepID=UPI003664D47D